MRTDLQVQGSGKVAGEAPCCIVLGLSLPSLAVIRSLGRKKVAVIGMDHTRGQIGSYSKYCRSILCPCVEKEREALVDHLVDIGRKSKVPPVLMPTNDSYTMFLAMNQEVLAKYFRFVVCGQDLVVSLNDKRRLCEIAKDVGVDVPRTFVPRSFEDLLSIADATPYPCIIKPAFGYHYGKVQVKGIVAGTPSELIDGWETLSCLGEELVVQEFVRGDDDLQYSLGVYFDRSSELVGKFVARKLRQNPPGTGVGTLVVSCEDSTVASRGVSFLKEIGFKGVAEVEFKKDGVDGGLRMIEVNTRMWAQTSLAVRCGMDLPYLAYSDACGMMVEKAESNSSKIVKWVDMSGDIMACLGGKGYVRNGILPVRNWIQSYSGPKEFAVFCRDDMLPYLVASRRFFSGCFRSLVAKVRRALCV